MSNEDIQFQSIKTESIQGVGPKFAILLNELGINNVFDLFFHLPFRYLDKTKITPLNELKANENALIVAKVYANKGFVGSKSKILKIGVKDEFASADLLFFNTYPNFAQNFSIGKRVLAFGKVTIDNYQGGYSISHPEISFLQNSENIELDKNLTPIYHLTKNLHQNTIRKIIQNALNLLKSQPLEELLDESTNPYKVSLNQAILNLHAPLANEENKQILNTIEFKRICLEELIAYQLSLITLKNKTKTKRAYALNSFKEIIDPFIKNLPFVPTAAQLRVFNEVLGDLQKDTPMMRLVHGDVGSGKTLIAMLCALVCALNNQQCAIMAPTEILAMQHYKNFTGFLKGFNIKIVLLCSSIKKAQRDAILESIKSSEAKIIIGTHSIFQDDVIYNNLCTAIIDEQHRFGTEQRVALLKKSEHSIHQLVMSATPIPRTLQLALYSDLDISVIDQMPPGRIAIQTALIDNQDREKLILRVKNLLSTGKQAYWVCPLINKSEDSNNASSATEVFEELSKKLAPFKIGLLHGRMKTQQKNEVMVKFLQNQINLLVATTVIEVGVDVPNSCAIIIESSDLMGLAQLHQLRGRVGRGSSESYCILLHDTANQSAIAYERLQILKQSNDGFEIAKKDLTLRGPGDLIGDRQSGFNNFKVADFARDNELLEQAREIAIKIKDNSNLSVKLIRRWFPEYII